MTVCCTARSRNRKSSSVCAERVWRPNGFQAASAPDGSPSTRTELQRRRPLLAAPRHSAAATETERGQGPLVYGNQTDPLLLTSHHTGSPANFLFTHRPSGRKNHKDQSRATNQLWSS